MSSTILITGGAGFIGSNFVPYFCRKYPHCQIVNLDLLTYAGSAENLRECEALPNYTFVQGDICNQSLLERLFAECDIRGVIHFAAESHVDNSIANPLVFVKTNVEGTLSLLHAACRHWTQAPHVPRKGYEFCRFHYVSTDEVYGSLGNNGYFTEETPYAPSSPYSASKAGADFLVRAFCRTFGMNITISNCSNNYGPKQHAEKLIPHMIEKALAEESLPVYGSGANVRDWLYVLDHCKAVDLIFHRGRSGHIYNIGGHNERSNIQIVHTLCGLLDERRPRKNGKKYAELITFVPDRPGHDMRYAIDASKITSELGWHAEESFETGIMKTLDWYLEQKPLTD